MADSVERYYQKKKKRKKKAKVVFFTLFFILILLTLAILSITVFFNADTITIKGNTHYSDQKILEQGGLEVGQNMFLLDKFEVIEKMEKLPYVKSVTINRKLPSALEITIVENEPVVWAATNDGRVALMNEEYRILELLSILEEQFPDSPAVLLAEAEEAEQLKDSVEQSRQEAKEESEAEAEEEKPVEEEKEPAEQEEAEQEAPEEEAPKTVHPRLKKLARLQPVKIVDPKLGAIATFSDKNDYSGFLKVIYESFAKTELNWQKVTAVQFNARYKLRVVYGDKIIIHYGAPDQLETKTKLAEYLMQQRGTAQMAMLVVSDIKQPYHHPYK